MPQSTMGDEQSMFGMAFEPAVGEDGQLFVNVTIRSGFTSYSFAIPESFAERFMPQFRDNFLNALAEGRQEIKRRKKNPTGLLGPDGMVMPNLAKMEGEELSRLRETVIKAAQVPTSE